MKITTIFTQLPSKQKVFVNQMRKTYDDATIIQAVKTCLKESKKYKR